MEMLNGLYIKLHVHILALNCFHQYPILTQLLNNMPKYMYMYIVMDQCAMSV